MRSPIFSTSLVWWTALNTTMIISHSEGKIRAAVIQNTLTLLLGLKVLNVGSLQSVIASFCLLLAVDAPEFEKLCALMFLNKMLFGSCSWCLSLGFYVRGLFLTLSSKKYIFEHSCPSFALMIQCQLSLESLQHLISSTQKMKTFIFWTDCPDSRFATLFAKISFKTSDVLK